MISKLFNLMMSILLFFSSLFGLGGNKDNSEIIKYNFVKTTVTVSLPENPSTGYRWTYNVVNENIAEAVSDSYVTTAPPDVVGQCGTRSVVFRGIKEGTTKIIFTYLREWEDSPIRTVNIILTVKSNKTVEASVFSDISKY